MSASQLPQAPGAGAELASAAARLGDFPLAAGGTLSVSTRLAYDPSSHVASGVQLYEERDGRGNRTGERTLNVRFYLFDRQEFEELARRTGFLPEALYGDYDRAPFREETSPYMLWRLQ